MALAEYNRKRDFKKTAEPAGKKKAAAKSKAPKKQLSFVVQEHHASHLHFDFRLELDGVLKSWAVPKGPSFDPAVKRMAVEVEDHPYDYGSFEGHIPEDEYGGGDVYIWDKGSWLPDKEPHQGLKVGRLEFELKGKKMKGHWVLIRTRNQSGSKPQWLLIKRHDEYAAENSPLEGPEHGDQPKKSLIRKKSAAPKSSSLKKKAQNLKAVLKFIPPQLAVLVDGPPAGDHWIHETKFDGYRTEAILNGRDVQLFTRTGKDWTHRYESIAASLRKLDLQGTILDGEIVWLDDEGRSDFQLLQNALKAEEYSRMIYYVFDLLFLEGEDLRELPLVERKEKLEALLGKNKAKNIRYSEHLDGGAKQFLKASCQLELEGIISKQAESTYVSRRSDTWLKSKCHQQQEFVIGGYTEEKGARVGFGALLLGVYEDDVLRYAGRCGTGFNQQSLLDLKKRLAKLEIEDSPFGKNSPPGKTHHWVKPVMTAEVTFSNWTQDGVLRVPVFHGLREDKPAREIKKEKAVSFKKAKTAVDSLLDEFAISHPDKILFTSEKITKGDVARYYLQAAKWMLPLIEARPLSLNRCPDGAKGSCFFQKHLTGKIPEGVHSVEIEEKKNKGIYAHIDDPHGLISLVQMGAFEIHVWNSRAPKVMNPDQFVMDFDPGPRVSWKQVQGAAFELKDILTQLKLKSFVKVTGGKGIHVHIPVAPIYTWDQIKKFSEVLAQEMVSRKPELYVATMAKNIRNKKIFVDYLRNGFGATAVAPYALRAREKTAVAMPITWEELKKLKSADFFSLPKAEAWLKKRKVDPWKEMPKAAKQKVRILKAE